MSDSIAVASCEMSKMKNRAIGRALVSCFDKICDTFPTNEEIAQHGHIRIHPDGREVFTWMGEKLFEVLPTSINGSFGFQLIYL